ncbi:hypothetical protein LV28_04685 [Pandoraea pnomenusa]|uniref:Uncharacterized protein conserved in bacteria n=2 Tax=Pandoraea pnomenusa TaxID=93220 RepID=A0A378YGC1_9BURK|nr:hypothetical protein LV28_04685 [Pandoraea pnomenusa]ANC43154.1 hypothetical protein A6P55_01625 [Pandoraea pnomenusa]SUA75590.1 Uncharacterized protein conserved in bacteria [Pandoraea pnomenusa]
MATPATDMVSQVPPWQAVLDFWFGASDAPEFGMARVEWFRKSDAFDEEIRSRFGPLHERALDGELADWAATPPGACALIVVLDQFSRNLYRGQAKAFAGDAQALAVAQRLVEAGDDQRLPTAQHRVFVYLPFEHDESLDSQQRSLALYERLAKASGLVDNLDYARKHAVIIERFGRYPHRNAALGRVSTPEEIEFLKQPGSSF